MAAAAKKRPRLDLPDGKSPFDGLHISAHDPLTARKQRSRCSQCGSSRKYFCYTCYIPVPELVGKLPKLKVWMMGEFCDNNSWLLKSLFELTLIESTGIKEF